MSDGREFPGLTDDAVHVGEWLCYADDVFEAANPDVDVSGILRHVLRLAIDHFVSQVRLDAYAVLQSGLVNHSNPRLDLLPLAERLQGLEGKELLLGLNAVGLSGDSALGNYIIPFLTYGDSFVRAEAAEALSELAPKP